MSSGKVLFTRAHYQAIAALLSTHYTTDTRHDAVTDEIVDDFVALFAADNPRFSRTRFLNAVEG